MTKAFIITIYLINTLLLLFILKIILGMGIGMLAAWFQLTSAIPTSGTF